MASGEQLGKIVDMFGFEELTEDVAATQKGSKHQLHTNIQNPEEKSDFKPEARDISKRSDNEVVVPIFFQRTGVKKYKVLARQKVEDEEEDKTKSVASPGAPKTLIVKGQTQLGKNTDSDLPHGNVHRKANRESPNSNEQRKENINTKVVLKKKMVVADKPHKLLHEKVHGNSKKTVKKSKQSTSSKTKQAANDAKAESRVNKTLHKKVVSKVETTVEDKSPTRVAVRQTTDSDSTGDVTSLNSAKLDSQSDSSKSQRSDHDVLKSVISKDEKNAVLSQLRCRVKLDRDPSIESIVTADEKEETESTSPQDMKLADNVQKQNDSREIKRQNSQTDIKTLDMVYDAKDIEVRKSGRLKSAKCASRYRGDYGIRVGTYTKLMSQKGIFTEENVESPGSDSIDGNIEELDSCLGNYSSKVDRLDNESETLPTLNTVTKRKRKSASCDNEVDESRLNICDNNKKENSDSLNMSDIKHDVDSNSVSTGSDCKCECVTKTAEIVDNRNCYIQVGKCSCSVPKQTQENHPNKQCCSCVSTECSYKVPCENCEFHKQHACDCKTSAVLAKPGSSKQFDGGTNVSTQNGGSKKLKLVGKLAKFKDSLSIYAQKPDGYVHSVGKSVKRKENSIEAKRKTSKTEKEVIENLLSPEVSPCKEAPDPLFVLENLRQKLFAKAGADVKEADKTPKNFESRISSSKRKTAHKNKKSVPETSSIIDLEVNESVTVESETPSGKSTPRCSTPRSDTGGEILEEISVSLESLQKGKQCSVKRGKVKRQRFEDKKFVLRSMSKEEKLDLQTDSADTIDSVSSSLGGNDNDRTSADRAISKVKSLGVEKECSDNDLKSEPYANKKSQEAKKPAAKPKPIKCQACNHSFKTRELLRKHYPCRVRQTRTWSQNKLRPNRAVKRSEPLPKKIPCNVSKVDKSDKPRPQLLLYRKTKFRKVKGKRRRRLYQVIQDLMQKRHPIKWPHLSIFYDDLSFKEQCFYKIGLMCTGKSSEGLERYSADEIDVFEKHRAVAKQISNETKFFKVCPPDPAENCDESKTEEKGETSSLLENTLETSEGANTDPTLEDEISQSGNAVEYSDTAKSDETEASKEIHVSLSPSVCTSNVQEVTEPLEESSLCVLQSQEKGIISELSETDTKTDLNDMLENKKNTNNRSVGNGDIILGKETDPDNVHERTDLTVSKSIDVSSNDLHSTSSHGLVFELEISELLTYIVKKVDSNCDNQGNQTAVDLDKSVINEQENNLTQMDKNVSEKKNLVDETESSCSDKEELTNTNLDQFSDTAKLSSKLLSDSHSKVGSKKLDEVEDVSCSTCEEKMDTLISHGKSQNVAIGAEQTLFTDEQSKPPVEHHVSENYLEVKRDEEYAEVNSEMKFVSCENVGLQSREFKGDSTVKYPIQLNKHSDLHECEEVFPKQSVDYRPISLSDIEKLVHPSILNEKSECENRGKEFNSESSPIESKQKKTIPYLGDDFRSEFSTLDDPQKAITTDLQIEADEKEAPTEINDFRLEFMESVKQQNKLDLTAKTEVSVSSFKRKPKHISISEYLQKKGMSPQKPRQKTTACDLKQETLADQDIETSYADFDNPTSHSFHKTASVKVNTSLISKANDLLKDILFQVGNEEFRESPFGDDQKGESQVSDIKPDVYSDKQNEYDPENNYLYDDADELNVGRMVCDVDELNQEQDEENESNQEIASHLLERLLEACTDINSIANDQRDYCLDKGIIVEPIVVSFEKNMYFDKAYTSSEESSPREDQAEVDCSTQNDHAFDKDELCDNSSEVVNVDTVSYTDGHEQFKDSQIVDSSAIFNENNLSDFEDIVQEALLVDEKESEGTCNSTNIFSEETCHISYSSEFLINENATENTEISASKALIATSCDYEKDLLKSVNNTPSHKSVDETLLDLSQKIEGKETPAVQQKTSEEISEGHVDANSSKAVIEHIYDNDKEIKKSLVSQCFENEMSEAKVDFHLKSIVECDCNTENKIKVGEHPEDDRPSSNSMSDLSPESDNNLSKSKCEQSQENSEDESLSDDVDHCDETTKESEEIYSDQQEVESIIEVNKGKSRSREGKSYVIKYEMNGLVIKENLLTGDKNLVEHSSPFRSSPYQDTSYDYPSSIEDFSQESQTAEDNYQMKDTTTDNSKSDDLVLEANENTFEVTLNNSGTNSICTSDEHTIQLDSDELIENIDHQQKEEPTLTQPHILSERNTNIKSEEDKRITNITSAEEVISVETYTSNEKCMLPDITLSDKNRTTPEQEISFCEDSCAEEEYKTHTVSPNSNSSSTENGSTVEFSASSTQEGIKAEESTKTNEGSACLDLSVKENLTVTSESSSFKVFVSEENEHLNGLTSCEQNQLINEYPIKEKYRNVSDQIAVCNESGNSLFKSCPEDVNVGNTVSSFAHQSNASHSLSSECDDSFETFRTCMPAELSSVIREASKINLQIDQEPDNVSQIDDKPEIIKSDLKVDQVKMSESKVVPSPPVLEKVEVTQECVEILEDSSSQETIASLENEPPILEPVSVSVINKDPDRTVINKDPDRTGEFEVFPKTDKSERHFLDVLGSVCKPQLCKDVVEKTTHEVSLNTSLTDKKNTDVNENIGRHFSDVMNTQSETPTSSWQYLINKSENSEVTLAEIKDMLTPIAKQKSIISKESLLKIRSGIASLLSKVKKPEKKDPSWLKRNALANYAHTESFENRFRISDSESDDEITIDKTSVQQESQQETSHKSLADNIMEMLDTFEDRGSIADNMSKLFDILAENLGFIGGSGRKVDNILSDSESEIGSPLDTSVHPCSVDTGLSFEVNQKEMIERFLEDGDGPPSLEDIPIAGDSDFLNERFTSDNSNTVDFRMLKNSLQSDPNHVDLCLKSNAGEDFDISQSTDCINSQHEPSCNSKTIYNDSIKEDITLTVNSNILTGVGESPSYYDKPTDDVYCSEKEPTVTFNSSLKHDKCNEIAEENHDELAVQQIPENIHKRVDNKDMYTSVSVKVSETKTLDAKQDALNDSKPKSKANTIFKSITELNSIETDEDSNGSTTFDDIKMSINLSELKVQNEIIDWDNDPDCDTHSDVSLKHDETPSTIENDVLDDMTGIKTDCSDLSMTESEQPSFEKVVLKPDSDLDSYINSDEVDLKRIKDGGRGSSEHSENSGDITESVHEDLIFKSNKADETDTLRLAGLNFLNKENLDKFAVPELEKEPDIVDNISLVSTSKHYDEEERKSKNFTTETVPSVSELETLNKDKESSPIMSQNEVELTDNSGEVYEHLENTDVESDIDTSFVLNDSLEELENELKFPNVLSQEDTRTEKSDKIYETESSDEIQVDTEVSRKINIKCSETDNCPKEADCLNSACISIVSLSVWEENKNVPHLSTCNQGKGKVNDEVKTECKNSTPVSETCTGATLGNYLSEDSELTENKSSVTLKKHENASFYEQSLVENSCTKDHSVSLVSVGSANDDKQDTIEKDTDNEETSKNLSADIELCVPEHQSDDGQSDGDNSSLISVENQNESVKENRQHNKTPDVSVNESKHEDTDSTVSETTKVALEETKTSLSCKESLTQKTTTEHEIIEFLAEKQLCTPDNSIEGKERKLERSEGSISARSSQTDKESKIKPVEKQTKEYIPVITPEDYMFCESIAEKVKRQQRERARPITYNPWAFLNEAFEPVRKQPRKEISVFRSSILEKRARERSLSADVAGDLCSKPKKRNMSLSKDNRLIETNQYSYKGIRNHYLNCIKECSVRLTLLSEETILKFTRRKRKILEEGEPEIRPPIKVKIKLNGIVIPPNSPYGSTSVSSDTNRSGYESECESSETEIDCNTSCDRDEQRHQMVSREGQKVIDDVKVREPIRIKMKELLTKMSSCTKESEDSSTECSESTYNSSGQTSQTVHKDETENVTTGISENFCRDNDVKFYISDPESELSKKTETTGSQRPKRLLEDVLFSDSSDSDEDLAVSKADFQRQLENITKRSSDILECETNFEPKPSSSYDDLLFSNCQDLKKPSSNESPNKLFMMNLVKSDIHLSESDSDDGEPESQQALPEQLRNNSVQSLEKLHKCEPLTSPGDVSTSCLVNGTAQSDSSQQEHVNKGMQYTNYDEANEQLFSTWPMQDNLDCKSTKSGSIDEEDTVHSDVAVISKDALDTNAIIDNQDYISAADILEFDTFEVRNNTVSTEDNDAVYYAVEEANYDEVKEAVDNLEAVNVVQEPVIIENEDACLFEVVETDVIPTVLDSNIDDQVIAAKQVVSEPPINPSLRLDIQGSPADIPEFPQPKSKYLYGINEDSQSSADVEEELITDSIGPSDILSNVPLITPSGPGNDLSDVLEDFVSPDDLGHGNVISTAPENCRYELDTCALDLTSDLDMFTTM